MSKLYTRAFLTAGTLATVLAVAGAPFKGILAS
jgi:hypothetical protein